MNIADKLKERASNMGVNKLAKLSKKMADKMAKDMRQLEEQIIVCQENQVEFEEYLKRIDENVKEIKNKSL